MLRNDYSTQDETHIFIKQLLPYKIHPLHTGLYTDERTNLNAPMLGMWDMNDRNTVKMVTESIAHLERKVVYIIPFSQLRVDTR